MARPPTAPRLTSAATDSAAADSAASEAGVSQAGAGDAEAGAADAGTVAEGTDAGETDAGETDAAQGVDLGTAPPLAGAQVCVYHMSAFPCVTTAADGTFTISGLPIRADLVLALTKSGYTSILQPFETASTDMDGRGNPILMDRPDPTFVPPGVTVDATKGIISAFAVGDAPGDGGSFVGIPGTTIALSPMSGSGPFYTSAMGGIDPAATSFETSGAYYFNVAPGTYTLTYTSSTFDCEPISFPFGEFGFPVTTPAHSLKLIVAAGYTTGIVGSFCTPNPVIVKVDGG